MTNIVRLQQKKTMHTRGNRSARANIGEKHLARGRHRKAVTVHRPENTVAGVRRIGLCTRTRVQPVVTRSKELGRD